MKAFELAVVTPEGFLLDTNCYQVDIPGSEGRFGVLAGHMNLIAQVKAGSMEVLLENGTSERIIVADGIAEVNSTRCTLLVEKGTYLHDINIEEIKKKLEFTHHQLAKASTETLREVQLAELDYLTAILENFNNAT